MTELERHALLGDKEAQKECTYQGILLPCPFCGNEYPTFKYSEGYGFEVKCPNCSTTFSRDFYSYGRNKDLCKTVTVGAWNTRPAPPIGRCWECVYSTDPDENGMLFCENLSVEMKRDNFCSDFKPKERKQ